MRVTNCRSGGSRRTGRRDTYLYSNTRADPSVCHVEAGAAVASTGGSEGHDADRRGASLPANARAEPCPPPTSEQPSARSALGARLRPREACRGTGGNARFLACPPAFVASSRELAGAGSPKIAATWGPSPRGMPQAALRGRASEPAPAQPAPSARLRVAPPDEISEPPPFAAPASSRLRGSSCCNTTLPTSATSARGAT